MNTKNKIFCMSALLSAGIASTTHAANVVTSADFANAWNGGVSPITVVGAPTVITGGYGITVTDALNTFGGANMSLGSSSGTPDGEALILGQYALAFAPNWNNGLTANVSNLSIYNAMNGAIFFSGNGIGAHNFTVDGTYFYGNNTGGNGGAVGVSSQIQSNASNQYILTDNDFVNNGAANGGAVYMMSGNSLYSGAPVTFNFSVIDDTGTTHFVALNQAKNGGSGGGIYFMGENAQGNITNQFTATGYNYFQNYAAGMGGAIYNGVLNGNAPATNNFNITGGQFVQNQTGGNGGAIANEINGGNTTVNIDIDGDFYSNLAIGNGGAIYTGVGDQYSPYGGLITINMNGEFNGNKAANGGALYNYIQSGQADIVTNINGRYDNNYASDRGGAIYNTSGNNNPGTSTLNIADGTAFSGNGATYGGAIYNSGNGVINFDTGTLGISLTNNYASNFSNGSDIYQDSATAVLNILGSGIFNINGGIGGIGTINQSAGTTFNLGDTSISGGYAGVFNNAAGATFNSYGRMFGGQNNFAGTANITSYANSFYFNANMLSGSVMNFTSTSTIAVSVGQAANNTSAGINFEGSGAEVNFIAGASGMAWFNLLNDIGNGQTNRIIFNNSDVTFGSTDYTGATNYRFFNDSIIDLAQSSSNYQEYTFGNFGIDSGAALSLKVGNNQGTLMADTIDVLGGFGTINLGKVYINDSGGIITGMIRVIYGSVLDFVNGEVQNVATGNGTYTVTTVNDQYLQFDSLSSGGGTPLVLDLNDVNALDTDATDAGLSSSVARSWQLGIEEIYFNDADLDLMATGTFSVYGAHARVNTSVLSGLNKTDQETKQSLFNIATAGIDFTLQDLTVTNAYSGTGNGGSVLYIDNADSTAILTNLVIQNNSSVGDGGAINILAGNIVSTDIVYINNSATGDGGAFSSAGTILKHGGQFVGNHADMNGGAICNNTGTSTTIYAGENGMAFVTNPVDGLSGMYFTGNSANGLGGAIHNAAGSTLNMASLAGADMVLVNNFDTNGTRPNDIYNDGTLNFTSTGGTFYIGSGIAGSGAINKFSPVVLELAATGDNSYFTGTFNQYNGIVNADSKFFGGTSNINSGILNWNANASKEDSAVLTITAGTINISGHLRLANPLDNIGPASTLNLYSGGILDIAGGTVYLDPKDINYGPGVAIQSDGYLVVAGHGLTVYSEVLTKTGGVTIIENNAVAYIDGSQPSGGIYGGDILVSNATLYIQGADLNVGAGGGGHIATYGNLGVGDNALINSIDGAIQTHTFAGKFAIISEISGLPQNIANFAVDLDAQNLVSDQFVFSGMAMPGELVANGNGAEIDDTLAVDAIVNLSQLNLINSPTAAIVPFNILSSPNYDPSLIFTAFDDQVDTPAGRYELVSLGDGNYELRLVSANPQAPRGGVATNAMFLSQLQITNIMFDHVFLDSNECLGCEYAPWQFQMRQKGVWAKGYGGGDRLKFGNGLDTVDNTLYGAIAGLDFGSVLLDGKQWRWMPTIYMAYIGGHQKFNDIEMMQNGAQIGMQNTWSDGDWIGAILTYGGIYNSRIEVGGTTDSVNNWFAGTGGKIAYDWRVLNERTILQPNLLVSYNYFGAKTWHSNYGDIAMDVGYLNGLNVAPGLAVITGITETVNLFISGIYNRNFMNDPANRIGEIDLPELKTPEWYFEYGLGVVGSIASMTTLDAKVSLRNGDNIDGIIGRIGISYRF